MKAQFAKAKRVITMAVTTVVAALSIGVPSFAANTKDMNVIAPSELISPVLPAPESADVLGAQFIWPTKFEPGLLGGCVYLSPTSWETATVSKTYDTCSIYYWPYGRENAASGVIYFTYDDYPFSYHGGNSAEVDEMLYQQYTVGLASSATSFWYVGPVSVEGGENETVSGREYAETFVANGITCQMEVFVFMAENYIYSFGFAEAGTMSTEMDTYINTLFLPYLSIVC